MIDKKKIEQLDKTAQSIVSEAVNGVSPIAGKVLDWKIDRYNKATYPEAAVKSRNNALKVGAKPKEFFDPTGIIVGSAAMWGTGKVLDYAADKLSKKKPEDEAKQASDPDQAGAKRPRVSDPSNRGAMDIAGGKQPRTTGNMNLGDPGNAGGGGQRGFGKVEPVAAPSGGGSSLGSNPAATAGGGGSGGFGGGSNSTVTSGGSIGKAPANNVVTIKGPSTNVLPALGKTIGAGLAVYAGSKLIDAAYNKLTAKKDAPKQAAESDAALSYINYRKNGVRVGAKNNPMPQEFSDEDKKKKEGVGDVMWSGFKQIMGA